MPRSTWSNYGADKRFGEHEEAGTPSKTVSVHPSKLRATQGWVDKRWKPSRKSKGPVRGLRDHKGNVHLVDGHHRAEHAANTGQHLDVEVTEHTKAHERAFRKKYPGADRIG